MQADMGLRAWRRLCAGGNVLVNDRPAGPEYKLRAGQCVTVLPVSAVEPAADGPDVCAGVCLVAQQDALAAVYKPSDLHSSHLAGGSVPSLEAYLANILPPLVTSSPHDSGFTPCLLNRLDGMTSGLVVLTS